MRTANVFRALLTTALLCVVQGALSETIRVTTAAEAKEAFGRLQSHQVIKIDAESLDLDTSIVIQKVSNVTIEGLKGGTTLVCPSDGLIMRVQNAENISLMNLRFHGCQSHKSAVEILGKAPGSGSIHKCSVAFKRCVFSDNEKKAIAGALRCTPESISGSGAAISGCYCGVSIRETTFIDNKAGSGGAINFYQSTIRVRGTSFTRNSAENSGAGFIEDSNTKFKRSSFSGNSAATNAGAMMIRTGHSQFTDCSFYKNEAEKATGAAVFRESPVTLIRCDFVNNTASVESGGGISISVAESSFISNCSFNGNRAGNDGGAVYTDNAIVTFEHSVFKLNTAKKNAGGAIKLFGSTATARNCSFVKNRASNAGGAIFHAGGRIDLTSNRFRENIAGDAGEAPFDPRPTTDCADCESNDEDGTKFGGALAVETAVVSLRRCHFDHNWAFRDGGALFFKKANATFKSCTFFGNQVGISNGGAGVLKTTNAKFSDCIFRHNRCGNGSEINKNINDDYWQGGALLIYRSTLLLKSSRFEWNRGREGGAVFVSGEGTIKNCSFSHNHAEFFGGAVLVLRLLTVIKHTLFLKNTAAERGGGLKVTRGESRLVNCAFVRNGASVSGGAISAERSDVSVISASFEENNSSLGGAVSLNDGSNFKVKKSRSHATFASNTAVSGGAIYCSGCGEIFAGEKGNMSFHSNRAQERGGAIFFEAAVAIRNRNGFMTFQSNEAVSGGAIYFANGGRIEFNFFHWRNGTVTFADNKAVYGGAMFIISQYESAHTIFMESINFANNRALRDYEYHRRPGQLRESKNIDQEDPKMEEDVPGEEHGGKGGALYVALKNVRKESIVQLELVRVDINHNAAVVGGGIYIENDYRSTVNFSEHFCKVPLSPTVPCQFVRFEEVQITRNNATLAGGGLFLTGSTNFGYLCAQGKSDPDILYTKIRVEDPCLNFKNNTVEGKDPEQNADVGTDAYSLKLKNINSSAALIDLNSGDFLQVVDKVNNSLRFPIEIEVKDQFGWTISRPIKDAFLDVELISNATDGAKIFTAINGSIKIKNATVRGGNIEEKATLSTADERNVSTSLVFATNPCPEGSLMDMEKMDCVRCDHHSDYTLGSKNECRQCEEHARCIGTTVLAPLEGYWHSTPFSPFFLKCTTEDACKWPKREEELIQYYYNHSWIERDLGRLRNNPDLYVRFEDYKQCKTGYTGMMCGSCADNYSRAADGECVHCQHSLALSIFIAVMMTIVLLLVLGIKLVLEIEGALSDVKLEMAKVADLLQTEHHRVQQLPSEQPAASVSAGRRRHFIKGDVNIQIPDRNEIEARIDLSPADARQSRVLNRAPLLVVEDDVLANIDTRMVSEKYVAASQGFSETYKILFNYIQLTSVALSMEIEWGNSLRWLLKIQSSAARFFSSSFLEPIECTMLDRDEDSNHSNLLNGMWFRTALPFISIIVFIALARIYKQVGLQGQRFKRFHLFPSTRMIFLILFFASIVDIITELTKMTGCTKPADSVDPNHTYAPYDILPSNRYVWVQDTSVVCWEGRHLVSSVFSIIGLVCCGAVILSTCWLLHYGKKKHLLGNRSFVKHYGNLYSSFRSDGIALYWGIIVAIRLSVLAFIGVITSYGFEPHTQICLMTALLFISTANQQFVYPYDHPDSKNIFPWYAGSMLRYWGSENWAKNWVEFNQNISLNTLESISLYMTLSIYVCGIAISGNDGSDDSAISALVLGATVINGAYVVFMIYRMYYACHNFFDVHLEMVAPNQNGMHEGEDSRSKKTISTKLIEYVRTTRLEGVYNLVRSKIGSVHRCFNCRTRNGHRINISTDQGPGGSATAVNIDPANTDHRHS